MLSDHWRERRSCFRAAVFVGLQNNGSLGRTSSVSQAANARPRGVGVLEVVSPSASLLSLVFRALFRSSRADLRDGEAGFIAQSQL